ncbi:hypothetical protein BDV09DRAFT_120956 [Aspergillus tetrazonus]
MSPFLELLVLVAPRGVSQIAFPSSWDSWCMIFQSMLSAASMDSDGTLETLSIGYRKVSLLLVCQKSANVIEARLGPSLSIIALKYYRDSPLREIDPEVSALSTQYLAYVPCPYCSMFLEPQSTPHLWHK